MNVNEFNSSDTEATSMIPDLPTMDSNTHVCEPTDNVVVPVFISLISAIGIFANLVVVFIVVILKEYAKSVTNIYVLQLAIADFIFLFQLPFHARSMVLGRWTYGPVWCKLSESIKMLNYYASIMFLTVMSVDRCLAINYPMNQKAAKLRSKRAALLVSCFFWTLAWLSTINILLHADVQDCHCEIFFPSDDVNVTEFYEYFDYGEGSGNFSSGLDYSGGEDDFAGNNSSSEYEIPDLTHFLANNDEVCSWAHASAYYKNWLICNFVMAFIFPLAVITLSYALIIRRILRPMVVGSKSQKSNKTRKRVTIMVTALVSAFVICWLPYHSFNLARLNDVRLLARPCKVLENFTLILAYSNSAVNPIFYTFLGTNFRNRWGIALGKARKGLRQSIMSHSGDYTPGVSMKVRRKSSAASSSGMHKNRDDVSVNSFVTKHTIVPAHAIVKEENV